MPTGLLHRTAALLVAAIFLHRADPHRHRDEEGAHADKSGNVLDQIGHGWLLLLICT